MVHNLLPIQKYENHTLWYIYSFFTRHVDWYLQLWMMIVWFVSSLAFSVRSVIFLFPCHLVSPSYFYRGLYCSLLIFLLASQWFISFLLLLLCLGIGWSCLICYAIALTKFAIFFRLEWKLHNFSFRSFPSCHIYAQRFELAGKVCKTSSGIRIPKPQSHLFVYQLPLLLSSHDMSE